MRARLIAGIVSLPISCTSRVSALARVALNIRTSSRYSRYLPRVHRLIDARDRRLGRYENQLERRASVGRVGRSEANLLEAITNCAHRRRAYARAHREPLCVHCNSGNDLSSRNNVRTSFRGEERTVVNGPAGSNAADLVEARRAAAFFLGRYTRRDSFIEVSIGSYNNYLSRIRGAYSPLPPAPYPRPLPAPLREAPLSSIRLELREYRGGAGEGRDGRQLLHSSRPIPAALINYLSAWQINICRL